MDEKMKQRVMFGVIGFNLTVIVYMIATSLQRDAPSLGMRVLMAMGIGFAVALVAFLAAFVMTK